MSKSTRTAPRHAAARRPLRLPWRHTPAAETCICLESVDSGPAASFGEALLGTDEPWRPTSLGVLGGDFMAQRPRVSELPARVTADVGAARVTSYQPSHTAPALAVHDPIRVKDGVKNYGSQLGAVMFFDCAADKSIGVRFPDGRIVSFAPDELDPAPVPDTLVMGPLDLVDDLVLMGGAR